MAPTISRVSHSSIASSEGRVPSRPSTAGCVRAVVGNAGFAEQRFDDGRAQHLRYLLQLLAGVQGSSAGQDGDFLTGVQNVGGRLQFVRRRLMRALRANTSETWSGRLRMERMSSLYFLVLDINGNRDVRDAAFCDGACGRPVR